MFIKDRLAWEALFSLVGVSEHEIVVGSLFFAPLTVSSEGFMVFPTCRAGEFLAELESREHPGCPHLGHIWLSAW